jgi:hypothetical protein
MTETTFWEAVRGDARTIAEKLKAIVHEGNVRRIIVQHQGRTVAEFPLTAGVVGAVLAPALAAIGAVVAVVKDCTLQVERVQKPEDVQRPKASGE